MLFFGQALSLACYTCGSPDFQVLLANWSANIDLSVPECEPDDTKDGLSHGHAGFALNPSRTALVAHLLLFAVDVTTDKTYSSADSQNSCSKSNVRCALCFEDIESNVASTPKAITDSGHAQRPVRSSRFLFPSFQLRLHRPLGPSASKHSTSSVHSPFGSVLTNGGREMSRREKRCQRLPDERFDGLDPSFLWTISEDSFKEQDTLEIRNCVRTHLRPAVRNHRCLGSHAAVLP